MNKNIFKSDRYFTVFDFTVSHGQLLLRASKDDRDNQNIDLIFFGVRYMQLFTSLFGLSVKLVEKDQKPINYNSVNSFVSADNNSLFEIETGNEKFYIGASYFIVYENELEFDESSLGLLDVHKRGKELQRSN
ncbi:MULTISPECIES: hypothetical protein [Sphingobacterium]|uniref:hypothetical protein n=1 Tax=Sphingobacterium TaxID=28453 RepID=UPI00257E5A1B|nr:MULTISPECIES: hypothetical protein [Sphingobacterium]